MGRPKDDCWNQVTIINRYPVKWKCNHCGREFMGGASRIKDHLGREKRRGIALCDRSSVPIYEAVNNSTVALAPSSDPMEVVNSTFGVAGGAQEEINNHMDGSLNHEDDTRPLNIPQGLANLDPAVGSSNGGFEEEIRKIKELIDMLKHEEDSIERALLSLQSLTGQKRKRETKVDDWLKEVEELKKRATQMIELLLSQGWSTVRSALEVEIARLVGRVEFTLTEKKPLVLSNELVGYSFRVNLRALFKLVRDDEVFIIGIHGMGGVGKTTLVTHFKNNISAGRDFKHVFWVTVSQDFSIFKLQSGIAKRVGIKLDEDDEIVERAQILSLALEKKGKLLLILDDVRNYIDLQKVGFPLGVNGIKLILTSRLKHVFQQMDCPSNCIIQIKPLSCSDDAWELFLLKLGRYGTRATLSDEVEEIARSIVRKCNGLPLGIGVMARIMKGVDDICQWRHVLNKFENSSMGAVMEDEVFRSLKLSYDHLMDKNIQNCFLRCALYIGFPRNELIMMLVDEGLIKETKSLEEIVDEGCAILNQLTDHSLFGFDDDDALGMNDLVRDMACYVVEGTYVVKCNQMLTKIPARHARMGT